MSDVLATTLTQPPVPAVPPNLLLDATSYAQHVLLQDRAIPWSNATAYSNHLSQAQALLKPFAALIPLDRMFTDLIATDDALRDSMSARTRTGFAAKTLLADEEVRTTAADLVATAAKTQREPVVLHLPSPLALLTLTTLAVDPSAGADFEGDDAESTAIYYADWLRIFAEHGIAGIIFDERMGAQSPETYQPIRGVAEQYRWPVGLRRSDSVDFLEPDASVPVMDAVMFSSDSEFDLPATGMLFAEIPTDAIPEQVLRRLEGVRACG